MKAQWNEKDTITSYKEGEDNWTITEFVTQFAQSCYPVLTFSAGVTEDSRVTNVASVALPTPPACVARGTHAGHLPVHVQVALPGELVTGGGQGAGTDLTVGLGIMDK